MGFLKQILPYLNNWSVSFLGTEILLLEFLMQMFQGGDSDVSVYWMVPILTVQSCQDDQVV